MERTRNAARPSAAEREQHRKLYLQTLERCATLERGIGAGRHAERHAVDDSQLALQVLGMALTPTSRRRRACARTCAAAVYGSAQARAAGAANQLIALAFRPKPASWHTDSLSLGSP